MPPAASEKNLSIYTEICTPAGTSSTKKASDNKVCDCNSEITNPPSRSGQCRVIPPVTPPFSQGAHTKDGTTMPPTPSTPIPIIFLKTPTTPIDPYTTFFTSPPPAPSATPTPEQNPPTHTYIYTYEPHHVPVLTHTHNITPVLTLLTSPEPFPYGGLIFTSQRAVTAFASALDTLSFPPPNQASNKPPAKPRWKSLEIPLYTVGPATATVLRNLASAHLPRCWVEGEEAGRGEMLAQLILERYNSACDEQDKGEKRPLLFLVGEKRRDIIPTTLTSSSLPSAKRLQVEEMVVYRTVESPSFAADLAAAFEHTEAAQIRWIVMFSPTAGETMLRALGWLDPATGRFREAYGVANEDGEGTKRMTYVASIGPTTQEYMKEGFGFGVDVCAGVPSVEGVWRAVEDWMNKYSASGTI